MTNIVLKSPTIGPIVGDVAINHARIWIRGDYKLNPNTKMPCKIIGIARLKPANISEFNNELLTIKLNQNFDFTGVILFMNLNSNAKYDYQIGYFLDETNELNLNKVKDISIDWSNINIYNFKTANDDKNAEIGFVFGSCRYLLKLFGATFFDDRGDKVYRSILNQIKNNEKVDKILMIGDQIYADDLNFLAPDTNIDEFLQRYRESFSQPFIKELMSQLPTYMILDDHEIEDNWPTSASKRDLKLKYPAAMHAYQIYQAIHSPLFPIKENILNNNSYIDGETDHYYYTFKDGCADFFVMDSRTERTKLHMISQEQLNSLFKWLLSLDEDGVKFIVTSVPFFPDINLDEDKWKGYIEQRNIIIDMISLNNIKKVVFLSGDVHCSLSSELTIRDSDKNDIVKIYSVVSSPFFWPYSYSQRSQFNLNHISTSVNNSDSYPITYTSKIISTNNFTRLNAKKDRLLIEVFSRKGELLDQTNFIF